MVIRPSKLIRRFLERRLRHLSSDTRGSAAVETAMLMIPFLTIMFAMLETGYMYLVAVMIEGATAESARQIRTGVVQGSGSPIGAFRQILCDNMYGVVSCDDLQVDVRSFAQFGGSGGPAMGGAGANAFAPGNAGDIVVVRVAYKVEFVTPFLADILAAGGGDGSRLLISSSAFRNEPFGEQG